MKLNTKQKMLKLFEQQFQQEWDNDLIHEMANVHSQYHGIPQVVIWVGKANRRHGLRIKVSNRKDHWNYNDNFTIMMPSLDYDPRRVADWITPKTMEQISSWIKLNQKLLYDYENDDLSDTGVFLQSISSIK